MFYLITNIKKGDTDFTNAWCRVNRIYPHKGGNFWWEIQFDLALYYSFYNHKNVKVAVFTDNEWYKSNELSWLKENYYWGIDRSVNLFDWGNIEPNDRTLLLSLSDRLMVRKDIEDKVEYIRQQWKENKVYNEFNW